MLRSGCIILSIWVILNLIPAAYIVVSTSFWDADSPAIGQILDATEIQSLTEKERSSINSVAVYANGLNVALSFTIVALLWFGVHRRMRWAYWAVCFGLSFAVAAGAMGDFVLGTVHPEITWISAGILVVGATLAGVGMRRRPGDSAKMAH